MSTWKMVSARQWVLVNDTGAILANVSMLGPYLGSGEVIYRATGPACPEVMDFETLAEAKKALDGLTRAPRTTR